MDSPVFIATTGRGIARASSNGGTEWSVEQLLEGHDVRCLAFDPLNPDLLFAGTQGEGLFASRDGGRSWSPAGLEGRIVKSIAASPVEPNTLFAGAKPPHLFVSRDSGANWQEVESFQKIPSLGSWWSPAEPPGTAYIQALALSPVDPLAIVAGIEYGAVVRSSDGGATWTDHRKGALPDCHTLTFHVSDGERVYEGGSAGAGAAVSRDAGATWDQPDEGLDRHYGWAVAADSGVPGIFYLSVSTGPGKAHGGRDAEAAIFRWSGNGPWARLRGGLPDPMVAMPYALVTHPERPGHIYAGFSDGGLWHSADYGEGWTRLPVSLGRVHRTMILVP